MKPILLFSLALMASLQIPCGAQTFGDDVVFLQKHTKIIVLGHDGDAARVAVSPAWQGRVMTSSAEGEGGRGFGFINREFIGSGVVAQHINVFGGEDRFWIGPEGGQFSIYFAPGAKFDLANWYVPAPLDTEPYSIVNQSADSVTFSAEFSLTNYSRATFKVGVQREVRLFDNDSAWKILGLSPTDDLKMVAYQSDNRISNRGQNAWNKESGLLSIWILGMFKPSPHAAIVVPIQAGSVSELGPKVTSDYFGAIPPDRFKVTDAHVFLSGDGRFRSKIGINPRRSKGVLGAYDADNHVLTVVQFDQPQGVVDYVNSLWKLQDNPFSGDVANSYNDGPPVPGAKPLGPFFEMESSSPAAALKPGESINHIHRTIHIVGRETSLDKVAQAVLGVTLDQINSALPDPSK